MSPEFPFPSFNTLSGHYTNICYSGLSYCVVWQASTNILQKHTAFTFQPEAAGSMFLSNAGIHLAAYTVS